MFCQKLLDVVKSHALLVDLCFQGLKRWYYPLFAKQSNIFENGNAIYFVKGSSPCLVNGKKNNFATKPIEEYLS